MPNVRRGLREIRNASRSPYKQVIGTVQEGGEKKEPAALNVLRVEGSTVPTFAIVSDFWDGGRGKGKLWWEKGAEIISKEKPWRRREGRGDRFSLGRNSEP
jgi:hypothetical protein